MRVCSDMCETNEMSDDGDNGDDGDDDDDWKIRKYWWSRYQSRRSGSVADIAAASATYTTQIHKILQHKYTQNIATQINTNTQHKYAQNIPTQIHNPNTYKILQHKKKQKL